jgi:general secretion pathway protein D
MLKTVSLLLSVFFIFACAPKEAVVPEEALRPPEEELVLPVIAPKPQQAQGQKPIVQPKSEAVQAEEDGKYIILNFDGADIETVIATFAEMLQMNYILSPGISGKVTIQSYKKVPTKDLFYIFQTLLEINGLTAVKDGPFYRIIQIDTAKQHPIDVEKGKEPGPRPDSSFVTQLIPLEYVKASEIGNVLRSLSPRGTDLIIYEPGNLLIVTALPPTLEKFMKLIDALDVSDAERSTVKTFVYYVENGEAKKLAEILGKIYPEKKSAAAPVAAGAARQVAPAAGLPRTGVLSPAPTSTVSEAFAGEIGEITIEAYEDINALIVKTDPKSYVALLELLKKIDVPQKQVLIEVLVASVTLDDTTSLGLEWIMRTSRGGVGGAGGFTQGSLGLEKDATTGAIIEPSKIINTMQSGFSSFVTGIVDSNIFSATINTLAKTGNFKVLASPHILAMDNKEAKIEIGREVPIATGLTQQPATGAGSSLVTTGQIQYRTVGTLLTVTPHITEKKRVTLKVTQEISDVEGGKDATNVVQQTSPTFTKKRAETTAVVEDGHTLVLGGLIEDNISQTRSGIPILSSIPILGYLFSTTTDTHTKTEFLVMVTPHVISNQTEADSVSEKFKNRVRIIKSRLDEVKEEEEKALEKEIGTEKKEAEKTEAALKEAEPKEAPKESPASTASPSVSAPSVPAAPAISAPSEPAPAAPESATPSAPPSVVSAPAPDASAPAVPSPPASTAPSNGAVQKEPQAGGAVPDETQTGGAESNIKPVQ